MLLTTTIKRLGRVSKQVHTVLTCEIKCQKRTANEGRGVWESMSIHR